VDLDENDATSVMIFGKGSDKIDVAKRRGAALANSLDLATPAQRTTVEEGLTGLPEALKRRLADRASYWLLYWADADPEGAT
jgi:hypothetical protein